MKTYEISKFDPCIEAIKFRSKYKTFREAWNNCPRGDWMLWIAQKLNVDDRTLTHAKALCAKTVIHLMKDDRSKKAIEKALLYAKGKLTRKTLNKYAAASAATYADAYAAYAAYADTDDDAAAKKKNHQKTADICRKILTKEVFKALKTK